MTPAEARCAAAAVVLGAATLAAPAQACPTAEQGFRRLASTEAEIAYRLDPSEPKVGQFFAAEVVACRAPGSGPVERIAVDATMPAHGHGMNYLPKAAETAPGSYRFTGLMMHMPGRWRMTIDVFRDGQRARLMHEVDLKP